MAELYISLIQFSMTCVGAQFPSEISRLITYDCLPDGEVHIHGVPKGYSITSLYGGSSCHVTQIDTNDYALGHQCTQRVYHNYPYYTYLYQADVQLSHSSHVVGGSGFSPFRLICDKVHTGGQMFTVQDRITVNKRSGYGSSVIPTLPYKRNSENNRRYTSSPQLTISRSQYSSQHIYGTDIGSLVYLHIGSGDSHFSVRPENCSAEDLNAYLSHYYSGFPSGRSIDLWDITQDRCVLEPYLMEKFRSMDTDQTEVAAPIYAFHFSDDPNRYHRFEVNFKCTVRVCGRRSFSCTLSVCDDVRREGRSAEEEDDDCDRHEVSAKITISSSASASIREYSSFITILSGTLSLIFTLVM
ncbi:uncharacterized protein [Argopecten irradians]|uniref:uncharacterized protein isoform X2 n=1 Tax=Argopecten irradians TaxID=31199 RepID=UPI0037126AEC